MRQRQDLWPAADEQLAKQMRSDGASSREIAHALGGKYSRSAVCGMAYRRKWESPEKIKVTRSESEPRRSHKKKVFTEGTPVRENPTFPSGPTVVFADMRPDQCRWPTDALMARVTGDTPFCGAEIVEGRPYCSYHCHLAYKPAPVRGRK